MIPSAAPSGARRPNTGWPTSTGAKSSRQHQARRNPVLQGAGQGVLDRRGRTPPVWTGPKLMAGGAPALTSARRIKASSAAAVACGVGASARLMIGAPAAAGRWSPPAGASPPDSAASRPCSGSPQVIPSTSTVDRSAGSGQTPARQAADQRPVTVAVRRRGGDGEPRRRLRPRRRRNSESPAAPSAARRRRGPLLCYFLLFLISSINFSQFLIPLHYFEIIQFK